MPQNPPLQDCKIREQDHTVIRNIIRMGELGYCKSVTYRVKAGLSMVNRGSIFSKTVYYHLQVTRGVQFTHTLHEN